MAFVDWEAGSYALVQWCCKVILHVFFREVDVVGLERIPLYGPVIFVGNHSNQFVDGAMLIGKMPRDVSFLVAAKSFHRPVIGMLCKGAGCIPVKRPQDLTFKGKGKLILTPGDKTVKGEETAFRLDFKPGDKVSPMKPDGKTSGPSVTIADVLSDTEAQISDTVPEDYQPPEGGAQFKVLPKVDQADVYDAVNDHLRAGGCIGIFPEGGSHDRTTLLPLKPGVAIMALSSISEGAEGVTIVPVGINYFEAHRFRSQAIIEIGMPIQPEDSLVERYQNDQERRDAVNELLAIVDKSLRRVILTAGDYEEQKCIRLSVSLYKPDRTKLPRESMFVMSQMFSTLWEKCRESPDIDSLRGKLKLYGAKLKAYGVSDNQVWRLRVSLFSSITALLYRVLILLLSVTLGAPLMVLWGPIWMICWRQSSLHQAKALKESKVKIRATDVLASYKILVALVMVPLFNLIYSLIFGFIYFDNWHERLLTVIVGMAVLPSAYYASLRQMEKVIPLIRTIRTLFGSVLRSVNLWRDQEREIAFTRMELQITVRDVIQRLGPSVSDTWLEQLNQVVPKVVVDADSKRLHSRKEAFVPKRARTAYDNRQEIL
ncbi:unnamed protein product [Vitrella brassicaformis CCMP3155]|uniref:Phospholipid/glycerol acyltransferase domain-containing protein n=2 Tax=Vitrella brassicaformis TaxID=1169539 RepID=A0A0G4F261_VITBC|nr:unnamed protein product [Vitrella brassicaformis CCMP3155]|mmetsp:Transcript_46217/g.114972  ORF Transcript_46217/g.114972 Transcript_46217/m.114972 type:complete len:599 (+) Transcript_46217:100-1896(+)|eukprot:CEM05710.1 unnamed protein product [Vitrella brassicaformis CCMP3155]